MSVKPNKLNNKSKGVTKLKKNKQKPIKSNSISNLNDSGKSDDGDIAKISTEVTEMLASLKKEHGITDKTSIQQKGNKINQLAKVAKKQKQKNPHANINGDESKPHGENKNKLMANLPKKIKNKQKNQQPKVVSNAETNDSKSDGPIVKKKKQKKQQQTAVSTVEVNDSKSDEPVVKKKKKNNKRKAEENETTTPPKKSKLKKVQAIEIEGSAKQDNDNGNNNESNPKKGKHYIRLNTII